MKYATIPVILLLIILVGCVVQQQIRPVDRLELHSRLTTSETISKALFSNVTGTIFGLSKDWQMIHFYRNQQRINSIGGMGLERGNFQRLTDIALDTDGSLLALDSVARKIVRFSSDGKWSGELELRGTIQPELFVQGSDQTLFVYDSASGEVICYSPLDNSEQFRFGKFQIYRITNLSLSRSYVVAFSSVDDQSHVFSRLGQYVSSQKGQIIYDDFDNAFSIDQGIVRSGDAVQALGRLQNPLMTFGARRIIVASSKDIFMLQPSYLRQ